MVELYMLEQLAAFARLGTLSAASEELHVSQPALSQSMRRLEERVGVPLFEREKNRLSLNENGRLAAEYARRILEQERDMLERVRLLDRSRRTVTLGACAPVPVWDLVPLLAQSCQGMTISSEIRNEDGELMEGLRRGRYQLAAVHCRPEGEDLYVRAYGRERLSLYVPLDHPLAERKEISLADLNGQNLLLYTDIGFWYEMCREKLPNAHFLLMNEPDAFSQVAGTGAFPSFVSDVMLERVPEQVGNRKLLPITDPEVETTYYCVCLKKEKKRFLPFLRQLPDLEG